jgi:hypothetical protein
MGRRTIEEPRQTPRQGGGARQRSWLVAGLTLATLAGCGQPPSEVEIDGERVASRPSLPVLGGATSAQRFDFSHAMPPARDPAARPAAAPAYDFMTPPGWIELAASGARPINLRPAGHPDAECYVSVLSGSGGGLVANVDRWRKQMGLDPLEPGEVEALPEVEVFGAPAKLLELAGDYSGMGSQPRPGWKLLGALQVRANASLFVKMTGPAEVVDAEREAFLAFCASLRAMDDGSEAASTTAQPAPEAQRAESTRSDDGPLRWEAPADWKETPPRPMRLVSYAMGSASECYVTVLGGEGGGLVANLDRWKGELGLERTTPDEVAALERVPMLGREAVLFEGVGDYSSMGGSPRRDSAVLGAICMRDQDSVFVKLIGPREEVLALREPFVRFLASFEDVQ